MLIIAHRGLVDGPDDLKQNHPEQVIAALDQGFDAEIDVWNINSQWFLGHDKPDYPVPVQFLTRPNLWLHCKNISAFYNLSRIPSDLNYFFHDTDKIVLTSKGYVWTYFGIPETRDTTAICVMPEVTYQWHEIEHMVKNRQWLGFCTDWPNRLKACLE